MVATLILIGILLAVVGFVVVRFLTHKQANKPDHFSEYLTKLLNQDDEWKP